MRIPTQNKSLTGSAIVDRLRIALGLTKDAEVARALKVTPMTVSGWRTRDTRPYAQCIYVALQRKVSLDWLLTGEGSMLREPPSAETETRAGVGAVETAARPDYAAQIAEVEQHWRMALATCAQDADFDRLLNFLEWLLDWWEAVGSEDRAWLDGQLRRHIKDYADWSPRGAAGDSKSS